MRPPAVAKPAVSSDAMTLVEAVYELDKPEGAWIRTLVERSIALVPGASRGVAFRLDASNPTSPKVAMPVAVGFDASFEREMYRAMGADPFLPAVAAHKVGTATELYGGKALLGDSPMEVFIREAGGTDAFGCVALDSEGRGIVVSTDLPCAMTLPRAVRSRWNLLGAHIAAAHRLRARAGPEVLDDCIAAPGGRILHAEKDAQSRRARDSLRDAVLARDRARTRSVRADPQRALALWPGLVSGRWSLIDRFESDGRRYVVARRNEPQPESPFALTLRERQVLGHLMQGDSVKLTAYALGRSPSTISQTAHTLLLKLGVRSVAELMALAAPRPS